MLEATWWKNWTANLVMIMALLELLEEKGIIDSLLKEGIITREEWKQKMAELASMSKSDSTTEKRKHE